jgi:hypothetical protein
MRDGENLPRRVSARLNKLAAIAAPAGCHRRATPRASSEHGGPPEKSGHGLEQARQRICVPAGSGHTVVISAT